LPEYSHGQRYRRNRPNQYERSSGRTALIIVQLARGQETNACAKQASRERNQCDV